MRIEKFYKYVLVAKIGVSLQHQPIMPDMAAGSHPDCVHAGSQFAERNFLTGSGFTGKHKSPHTVEHLDFQFDLFRTQEAECSVCGVGRKRQCRGVVSRIGGNQIPILKRMHDRLAVERSLERPGTERPARRQCPRPPPPRAAVGLWRGVYPGVPDCAVGPQDPHGCGLPLHLIPEIHGSVNQLVARRELIGEMWNLVFRRAAVLGWSIVGQGCIQGRLPVRFLIGPPGYARIHVVARAVVWVYQIAN